MLEYPSIPRNFTEIPNAHIWDKIDGSSMRSEYSHKRGFYKHGRRGGLIDASNPHLIIVPSLFESTLAEPIARLAKNKKWDKLIVFYEFWGQKSFAGMHEVDDPKFLTVFDASLDGKNIMPTEEFRKHFDGVVEIPAYLGRYNWTRGFVDRVWSGEIEGITLEGVVEKNGSVRAKAKTKTWIDKIHARYDSEEAKKLIES